MLWLYMSMFIFIGILILTRRDKRKMALYRQIPCTSTRLLPIIGHSLQYIGSSKRSMDAFILHGEEATKKGGLMGLWHTNSLYIFATDAVDIEHILKNCLEKDDLMKLTRLVLGNCSIFAPVPIWRPRRKLLIPSFKPKALQGFVDIFSKQSLVLVDRLKSFADKNPVSVWDFLITYSLDAVCESTFGIKLGAQTNPDDALLNIISQLYNLAAQRMTNPLFHNDFIFTQIHYKIKEYKKMVHNFVDKLIEEKRTSATALPTDNTCSKTKAFKSFMEMMIDTSVDDKTFTDIELREETFLLMIAAIDTTSTGAGFTTLLLSRHQDVQEKVYQELQEVFGDSDRPVVAEDLHHLKYLEAVIKEAMRLFPPTPVITRKVESDLILPSGITLVKGCGILVHLWALHRNPQYWGPDAEVFRPERFLDGPPKHPAAFIPFSYGPRSCIAQQYAYMSMKTNLANILRRYRILPAEDPITGRLPSKNEPLNVLFDISIRHADNYIVRLQSRVEVC